MTSPHTDTPPGDAPDAASPSAAPTRRLLLRRGLGVATPVVLTLASLPSHAAAACINPSGFISRATFNSRHPGGVVCTTNGPTYFAGLADASWPTSGGLSAAGLTFSAVFNSLPTGGTGPSNSAITLKQVLTGSYGNFAKYCVALYANALSPPTGFLTTVDQARALWGTVSGSTLPSGTSSFPQPSLGWSEATALEWLATVMSP